MRLAASWLGLGAYMHYIYGDASTFGGVSLGFWTPWDGNDSGIYPRVPERTDEDVRIDVIAWIEEKSCSGQGNERTVMRADQVRSGTTWTCQRWRFSFSFFLIFRFGQIKNLQMRILDVPGSHHPARPKGCYSPVSRFQIPASCIQLPGAVAKVVL